MFRQVLFFKLSGRLRMLPFLVRQLVQQLARASVRNPVCRFLIETHRLQFHQPRVFACCVDSQRTHKPHRTPLQKSLHVLSSNRWNVIPESLAISRKKPVAVCGLFFAHFLKHLRRRRIRFFQLVSKLTENPSVFFFILNRQRQDFPLGQILEFLQHSSSPRKLPRRKNRTIPPWKSSLREKSFTEKSDASNLSVKSVLSAKIQNQFVQRGLLWSTSGLAQIGTSVLSPLARVPVFPGYHSSIGLLRGCHVQFFRKGCKFLGER